MRSSWPWRNETPLLRRLGKAAAKRFGFSHPVIAWLEPLYTRLLAVASLGRGIPISCNGYTFRVEPQRRNFFREIHEPGMCEFLKSRIRPGQKILDVGANVGLYVLQGSRWNGPDGKMIAVEPNPHSFRSLRSHIRYNKLQERVIALECAVADSPGSQKLYFRGADGMSRLGAVNFRIAESSIEKEVAVRTIDDICEEFNFVPDWLLMDIEGYEFAAIRGAHSTLQKHFAQVNLVVEMHPDCWSEHPNDHRIHESILRELGYRPVPLDGQLEPLGHGAVFLEKLT